MVQSEVEMKSITIHGVDEQLAALLKQEAEKVGTSMNRTVKRLLEEALGLKPRSAGRNREVFKEFLGVWSQDDLAAFNAATADFETIDESDWR
jgi:hypothetical protein